MGPKAMSTCLRSCYCDPTHPAAPHLCGIWRSGESGCGRRGILCAPASRCAGCSNCGASRGMAASYIITRWRRVSCRRPHLGVPADGSAGDLRGRGRLLLRLRKGAPMLRLMGCRRRWWMLTAGRRNSPLCRSCAALARRWTLLTSAWCLTPLRRSLPSMPSIRLLLPPARSTLPPKNRRTFMAPVGEPLPGGAVPLAHCGFLGEWLRLCAPQGRPRRARGAGKARRAAASTPARRRLRAGAPGLRPRSGASGCGCAGGHGPGATQLSVGSWL
mmetsp:Transcript_25223/g.65495  ORF Transcript_25223/g.65495 Transcript_25223/m.65495 type:complete len:273 (-) Transcript_25223:465-1283(-)